MKHTILISILTMLLASCSTIRTDGAMNYKDTVKNMIYFKVNNFPVFLTALERTFGKHDNGEKEHEYWWRNKTKKDWTNHTFDLKLMVSGSDKSNVSIAIVTEQGKPLTDKTNATLPEIKDFFSNLIKVAKE